MVEKREEALKTIEFYKKEMESTKPNYSAYCALGYAYFDIEEYLKAIKFYNKANEFKPDSKEYDEMKKAYLKAVELDSETYGYLHEKIKESRD